MSLDIDDYCTRDLLVSVGLYIFRAALDGNNSAICAVQHMLVSGFTGITNCLNDGIPSPRQLPSLITWICHNVLSPSPV